MHIKKVNGVMRIEKVWKKSTHVYLCPETVFEAASLFRLVKGEIKIRKFIIEKNFFEQEFRSTSQAAQKYEKRL